MSATTITSANRAAILRMAEVLSNAEHVDFAETCARLAQIDHAKFAATYRSVLSGKFDGQLLGALSSINSMLGAKLFA